MPQAPRGKVIVDWRSVISALTGPASATVPVRH